MRHEDRNQNWIHLDPAEVTAATTTPTVINGVKLELFVPPFAVPEAVRGSFNETSQLFEIEFRYSGLSISEDRLKKSGSKDGVVQFFVDGETEKIIRITIDVKSVKADAVELELKHRIESEGPVDRMTNLRKLNLKAAASAIHSKKAEIFRELTAG